MPQNLLTLGQRVRFARLNAGFTSQDALAKKIGVSQQSLARIELGLVQKPRILHDIALATGYSANWLATGQGASLQGQSTHFSDKTYVLELIDIPNYLDPIKTKEFQPEHFISLPIQVSSDYFLVKVDGDSMVSVFSNDCSFKDGTIIIVDPKRAAKNGNFVIAQFDHVQPPIFKKYREDAGHKYLMPLNPLYTGIRVDHNPHYKILGVVVAHLTIDL
ncbi:MAG: putative prophage repressor [Gammaproteobacteria bacterium]|jgi:SOS-response transcriptional repressor LexA|nr:putative prophage repressor [Gammaproteobacteria bacterium]